MAMKLSLDLLQTIIFFQRRTSSRAPEIILKMIIVM